MSSPNVPSEVILPWKPIFGLTKSVLAIVNRAIVSLMIRGRVPFPDMSCKIFAERKGAGAVGVSAGERKVVSFLVATVRISL